MRVHRVIVAAVFILLGVSGTASAAILELDGNAGLSFFLWMVEITKLTVIGLLVMGLSQILGDFGSTVGRSRRIRREKREEREGA